MPTKTFIQVLAENALNEDFETILNLWGIDETDEDGIGFYNPEEYLAQRTSEPTSARFVWEYLDADERTVLYTILETNFENENGAGKGIERSKLLKLVSLPETRFDKVLTQLAKYALISLEQTRTNQAKSSARVISTFPGIMITLHTVGRELFVPTADRSTHSLSDLLLSYSPAHLYQLLKIEEVLVPFSQAKTLSLHLAEVLRTRDDPFAHLPSLDPVLVQLYQRLRAQGGRLSMREVRSLTGLGDPALRKIIEVLEYYALAFDTLSQGERVLFIPQDVLTPPAALPASAIQHTPAEPTLIRTAEPITLFDIAMLVGLIHQQRIELTQSGAIMKRFLPKLRASLLGLPRNSYYEEDNYSSLLFRVMNRLQLVTTGGNAEQGIKNHFQPGPALSSWIQKDAAQQIYDFLRLWEEGGYWVDMAGMNFTQDGYYYPNSSKGRKTLLKHLATFTKGQWHSVDDLLARIWEQDPLAMQPISGFNKQERLPGSSSHLKWRIRDGELYVGSLGSTLFEAGLVDLGYNDIETLPPSAFHNPSHFMLTELGAEVLGIAEKAAVPETQKTLLVQPNFEILLLQPDLPTLYLLFPFALVNQVGLASKLTLSQSSILKGLEGGLKVEQIIALLQAHSQKELPQNIVYSIRDWAKNYREATVSQILLLEVSDEAMAHALCSSTKLKKFGFRMLGETAVVTQSDVDVSELRRTLEKEGIVVHIQGNIASQKQNNSLSYGLSGSRFR